MNLGKTLTSVNPKKRTKAMTNSDQVSEDNVRSKTHVSSNMVRQKQVLPDDLNINDLKLSKPRRRKFKPVNSTNQMAPELNRAQQNISGNKSSSSESTILCPLINDAKTGSKNSIEKKTKDKNLKNISNITHKKCSGNNNWIAFLSQQNLLEKPKISLVKDRPSLEPRRNVTNGKVTKHLALDCEFVGIGENGKDNMLARVSVVNSHGDCLYDKYVKPREPVTDFRTFVSGIRPGDMEKGEDFESVQKDIATLLKGKILVGHSLKNDLEVLFLTHPRYHIRDTSKYFREAGKMTPSLKLLAQKYLGISIQEGEHSSVQDAQAAMHLYNMFRKQWEAGGGNKKANRIRHPKPKSNIKKL